MIKHAAVFAADQDFHVIFSIARRDHRLQVAQTRPRAPPAIGAQDLWNGASVVQSAAAEFAQGLPIIAARKIGPLHLDIKDLTQNPECITDSA